VAFNIMSKKRGLSRDEKKDTILSIFRESKEPYAIQDIEKVASKRGVVLQTVKDIVLELVDDGDVLSDKIGVTTFYWSFPSEAVNKRKKDIEKYTEESKMLMRRREELEADLPDLQKGREQTPERAEKLARLETVRSEIGKMREELRQFAENDPAVVDAMEVDIKAATDAANRWTDNIFSLRSWAVGAMNVDKATFDQNFGLPGDFDYYEPKQ